MRLVDISCTYGAPLTSVKSHILGESLKAQDQVDMETVVARMLLISRGIIHNEQRVGNKADHIREQMAAYKIVLPVADLLSSDNHNIVREAMAFLVEIL